MGETSFDNWVWLPTDSGSFAKGEIVRQNKDHGDCQVRLEDGSEQTIKLESLQRVNPPRFDKCDDMAALTYLNEPSVVHNLKTRYSNDLIYTYSGLFLVAINPYKSLNIYNDDFIQMYRGSTLQKKQEDSAWSESSQRYTRPDALKPHIFATAEEAFQKLLQGKKNQSILVTGESGAGKTENTKKVIQYITSVASSSDGKNNFEQQIIQANPILESFGNAQTVKNNNSSRFGKFVKISIDPSTKRLVSGHIEWYLLEKSRVVLQNEKERNYHIFYQMLKGLSDKEMEDLGLTRSVKEYGYLKIANHSVVGIDDRAEFQALEKALKIIGFSASEKKNLFKVIAAILLLGNVSFTNPKSDKQAMLSQSSPISQIAELLGVKSEKLKQCFLSLKVKAGKEKITQKRTSQQAKFAIDAFAKSLYEKLFKYIVDKVNQSFTNHGSPFEESNFIGILDIAGFEIFEKNSFEQLCINLTNEKLQYFFNHHMFVLEQSEYIKENISWEFIDFGNDLKPTIELIEGSGAKKLGIFPILDEECVVPKGSDSSFLEKLHDNLETKDKKADKDKIKYLPNKIRNGFIIKHYAGEVDYNISSWLQKNKDPLSDDIVSLMSGSSDMYFQDMFEGDAQLLANETVSRTPGKKGGMFRTVAQKHKEQLNNLMKELESTEPHFVRCILPNTEKVPGKLSDKLVLDQLRCNGVLEGIRIARSGYPNRVTFEAFFDEYAILSKSRLTKNGHRSVKQLCELILAELELKSDSYKVGLTKIFFRNSVLANLEKQRSAKLSAIFSGLQAVARGNITRKRAHARLQKIRAADLILESLGTYHELNKSAWFKLFVQLKPVIGNTSTEDVPQKDKLKFEKRIKLLDAENKKIKSELDVANEKVKSSKQDLSADKGLLDQKEHQLQDANSKILSLKTLLERNMKEVKSLKDQLEAINDKYSKDLSNKEKLEKSIVELEEKLEAHDADVGKLSALQKKVSDLEEDLKNKERVLSSTESKLERACARANLAVGKQESTNELQEKFERLTAQHIQLKHESKEAKTLLEAKIADEVRFERGRQKYDEDLKKLQGIIQGLKTELEIERSSSAKMSLSVREIKAENDRLSKAKKSYDVKLAETKLQLSKAQPLTHDHDLNSLRQELRFTQNKLAAESYDNRQLRACLKNAGIEANQVSMISSPMKSSGNDAAVERERAANKRLEKMNIELQKELASTRKSASANMRGMDFNEASSYRSLNPLSESSNRLNTLDSDAKSAKGLAEVQNARQENLRLNSMLNETTTKLKRLQLTCDATFVQQEQLAQLKTKLDVTDLKNKDLLESLELYKSRAESYYSKLEAADVTVQTAKRAEEMVKNELRETKLRLKDCQEEFRNSDISVAKLHSAMREVERELSDTVFQLKKVQEQYDSLKEKCEKEEEFRSSVNSNTSTAQQKELDMLNSELLTYMNKETDLSKRIRSMSTQLDASQKENMSLKAKSSQLTLEKTALEKLLVQTNDKNHELNTEKQEGLIRIEAFSAKVKALEAANEDLETERNQLLESKRVLERKVEEISKEFDAHLAKAKEDASNSTAVTRLTQSLSDERKNVETLRYQLQSLERSLKENQTALASINKENMLVVEENKALTKFNRQLKSKMGEMETKFAAEKQSQTSYWNNRVIELEDKIFAASSSQRDDDQKLYDLQRTIKDVQHRHELQSQTIQRLENERKSLEETIKRLDNTIDTLQQQESEAKLAARRAEREKEDYREQSLMLEKELLDWKSKSAAVY
ncbi:unnamed protein product [Kuraishia capsulata CBS 1993]|uniref:Myosin motor domain-containing protein n=1 Tax=Kuraishia capsulata CBS 1993 TaxID=1382522 RepID=W6MKS1_9ASCO|nr:uncharacterized protein KUCA_T00002606001 [Kuraishia capsulata CBS 1993]CDK26633.1 unnamed protein product [Kuraishia capsulata CBS 1993]